MAGNPHPNMSGLRPMHKGGKGLSKGRPKKWECFADIAAEMLASRKIDIILTQPNGTVKNIGIESSKSFKDAIILGLTKKAIDGDVSAAKELMDRTDGKVTERHEISDMTPRRVIFTEVKLSEAERQGVNRE